MGSNINGKLAGPLPFDESAIKRDAQIPEQNDAKPVDETAWLSAAEEGKENVFLKQQAFFDELKKRAAE
jgi:hypothetical protein